MPTYMTMMKWTSQGLQNVKDSPSRLDAARKGFEKLLNVHLKDFYMVTGQYDVIAVIEAPDDEALAKAVLITAADGNVTTETCRAFTENEYRKVCSSLP